MTASVHAFPAPAARPNPAVELRVGAQSADEASIAAHLLMTCAPPHLDKLECCPAIKKREGHPYEAIVIVESRGLDVYASADTIRRIAVSIDSLGRTGAALDLMQAADQAEQMARHYQRSAN